MHYIYIYIYRQTLTEFSSRWTGEMCNHFGAADQCIVTSEISLWK